MLYEINLMVRDGLVGSKFEGKSQNEPQGHFFGVGLGTLK